MNNNSYFGTLLNKNAMPLNIRHCITSLIVGLLCLTQCSDPYERYEDPPWLSGTNIETLEKEGNYKIFLELMDRAEYRVSIENQLFTLFVPSDSAFEAYFEEVGILSVADLTKQEAEQLFGLHILINPRSRDQLIYEYVFGELQDPEKEYGSLFHRKTTYSYPKDYYEVVRYNEQYKGEELRIGTDRIKLPLFTTEYFTDYFGDPAGSDYLFMYPESSWSGTQWHDAMVTVGEVLTSSGFIYYVDRVVKPPPTIETYLIDNKDKFGLFYDLAQRFATYGWGGYSPDPERERRYKKGYNNILNFADGYYGPSNSQAGAMLYMFSAFIPYDHILEDYLDNTILKSYASIDDVPKLFLVYLLQSHLYNRLALPSKMQKRFLNYYGDEIPIDIDKDIDYCFMTCNGPVYAMNKILEPNAFTMVPGPLFYRDNYTTFLFALELSNMLTTITKPDIDVTLFAPDNALLAANGIRQNTKDDLTIIEVQTSDGEWHQMEQDDIEQFVRDYIYYGHYDNLNGEGYIRMASDNFIYYNNDVIKGGGNQIDGDDCEVLEKLPSDRNGNLFRIDNVIKAPGNAAEVMLDDPDLSSFVELLGEAALIDSVQKDYERSGVLYPRVIFLSELSQWTLLAPTNQAIADAEATGLIPNEEEELRKFIYYHFVRNKAIFDDGIFSGTANTHQVDTIIDDDVYYKTLYFTNSVHNLNVTDLSGQTISIGHNDANILMEHGVLHKIDAVLLYEE